VICQAKLSTASLAGSEEGSGVLLSVGEDAEETRQTLKAARRRSEPNARRLQSRSEDDIAATGRPRNAPGHGKADGSKATGNRPRRRRGETPGTKSLLFGTVVETGSQWRNPSEFP
jgi:hypothetical protein